MNNVDTFHVIAVLGYCITGGCLDRFSPGCLGVGVCLSSRCGGGFPHIAPCLEHVCAGGGVV